MGKNKLSNKIRKKIKSSENISSKIEKTMKAYVIIRKRNLE
jgi:hypothetical protein